MQNAKCRGKADYNKDSEQKSFRILSFTNQNNYFGEFLRPNTLHFALYILHLNTYIVLNIFSPISFITSKSVALI